MTSHRWTPAISAYANSIWNRCTDFSTLTLTLTLVLTLFLALTLTPSLIVGQADPAAELLVRLSSRGTLRGYNQWRKVVNTAQGRSAQIAMAKRS